MNWSIGELRGKYYGTEVKYEGETKFKIWIPDHFAVPFASERELICGPSAEEDGHDHVEDQQSYRLAKSIVDHLNHTGFTIKG